MKASCCIIFLLITLLTVHRHDAPTLVTSAAAPIPSHRQSIFSATPSERHGANEDERLYPNSSSRKWTSCLSVDPSIILSTLIKHGGIFIPKSVEKDVEVLRQVLGVESAELNVMERKLILHNVTISLPHERHKKALRIGRVYLYWDSYLKPCLDIEVEEVDVLVEFINLMLTRNNWNELAAFGFPPDLRIVLPVEDDVSSDKTSANHKDEKPSLLRINSITLSKNMTILVNSRPLKKKIGIFSLDMDATDEINRLIRQRSDFNLRTLGSRGCTPRELALVLQNYIGQKVRVFVSQRIADLDATISTGQEVFGKTSSMVWDSVNDYALDAGRKTGESLQDAVASKLSNWGWNIPNNKIEDIKRQTIDAVKRLNITAVKEKIEQTQAAMVDKNEKEGDGTFDNDYIFPDW